MYPYKSFRRALPALGLFALSGCMVGPNYHRPKLVVPAGYKEAAGWLPAKPAAASPKGAWWTAFDDPLLDKWEPQVVVNNATVAADYYAYQEATQIVQETRGGLFPTVGLSGSATRSGEGGGNTGASAARTGNGISTSGGPSTSGNFEGTVDWTPDIWGTIRREVQSNVAAAQVSAADLANATLSEQGLLAADYVDLRASDALIALFKATVVADQQALQITINQYNAGTVPPSDVITARTQLEGAQADLINAGVARAQYEHAIAVLLGRAPADLTVPPGVQILNVPVPPPGLPSTLLERRPDIAAAERAMAQANADVGVEVGAYYPQSQPVGAGRLCRRPDRRAVLGLQ